MLNKYLYIVIAGFLALFLGAYLLVTNKSSNQYIINNFIAKQGYSTKTLTLSANSNLVDMLNTELNKLNSKVAIVPVFFTNFPTNFASITNSANKQLFINNILLPLIVKVEQKTIEDRQTMLDLVVKLLYFPLTQNDIQTIRQLADFYGVSYYNVNQEDYNKILEELLLRIDIVPKSVILALATAQLNTEYVEEIIKNNAVFNSIYFNNNFANVPANTYAGAKNKIKRFGSLLNAVQDLYITLNTNPRYLPFREQRLKIRLNSSNVVSVLDTYTEIILNNENSTYTENPYNLASSKLLISLSNNINFNLSRVINSNNLTVYDTKIEFNQQREIFIRIK